MKRISTILSIVLCTIMILGPLSVAKGMFFPGESKDQDTRVHTNTGNTTRIMAKTSEELSLRISDILYPSINTASKPNGYILIQSEQWQDIMTVLPLAQKYNSIILSIPNGVSTPVAEYIDQRTPLGIPQLEDTQILVLRNKPSTEETGIQTLNNLKSTVITYSDTNNLMDEVNNLPENNNKTYGFVVLDNDPLHSLPAATWIVNQGGTLLFADGSGKLYPSSEALLRSGKIKKVYPVGKESSSLEKNLKNLNVDVHPITADSAEQLSIRFAEFYDPVSLVGWNATLERRDSGHNYILASTETPSLGALAVQLAIKGKTGPLLWTKADKLSPIIENYLWKMKPDFWVTPAEGPFNHTLIVGDDSILNYKIQGRIDFIEEIQSYGMQGEQAVSGLDVLSILSILISIAGAMWITLHLFFRMKHLFILTKIMWILLVLLLGPVGIWLYIVSYKDRPWMKMGNNTMWKRPLWNQAAVATATGLAFGASTMVSTAYLLTLNGLPLIPLSGRFGMFLFGNPMILQFIIVYVVAFILNSTVFMPTMLMRMRNLSYKEAVKNSIPTVAISMTSVSLGMMTAMWWLKMEYLPMMPEEDHILWWGVAQAATLIGGLTAFIPNWRLVRYGRKMGTA